MQGALESQPWAAVQWAHANGSGVITVSQLEDFAEWVGNSYASNVIALMHEVCTMATTSCTLYETGEDQLTGEAATAGAGVDTGTGTPNQSAAGISWTLARGYKGGHPRTYVPGVAYSFLADFSHFDGAFTSDLTDGANLFHTTVEEFDSGSTWTSTEHGTMSFVRNKEWRVPPVFVRFTGAHVDSRIDTQRRRLGPDIP